MKVVKPLSTEQFINIAKSEIEPDIEDHQAFFAPQIKEARNFAVGPYYWFIGNNARMQITVASDNIGDLSPYNKSDWENKPTSFFIQNLHPDDCYYVLSALQLAVEKIVNLPIERQADVRLSVYARMLNAQHEFRWVLIQMPSLYVSNEQKTTCALMMVTDLTHFNFENRPVLMTLTDRVNNKNEYYHIALGEETKLVAAPFPSITKREQEILQLMTKGLNTPQIAKQLFISFHTVENHKRNLRKKTNTKTAAELIYFVQSNCMI